MAADDALERAYAKRREVLGDDYVDRATAGVEGVAKEFQDHLTAMAWGTWAREGPLSTRDRSMLVLAITAATGRMEELRIHLEAAPRAGVTDAEIDELLFTVAAYAGGPAAVGMRRLIEAVRAERDT